MLDGIDSQVMQVIESEINQGVDPYIVRIQNAVNQP